MFDSASMRAVGRASPARVSLLAAPGYVLMILMSVFPMVPALSALKVSLFATVLLAIVAAALLTGRLNLHPTVALGTFCLAALSFGFVLEGFLAGGVGAAPTASVYVIWPMIYGLAIAGILNERILMLTARALLISVLCIALHGQLILLTKAHVVSGDRLLNLLSFGWKQDKFLLGDGYIFMQYPGLNSLPFLVPFSLAALVTFLPRNLEASPLRRSWLWAIAFLGVAAVPMTGRRALFLVTLAAPAFTFFFSSFQPSVQRRRSRKTLLRVTGVGVLSIAAALGCLKVTYGFDLSSLGKRFSAGFTFRAGTGDTGAAYRREQYYALLDG